MRKKLSILLLSFISIIGFGQTNGKAKPGPKAKAAVKTQGTKAASAPILKQFKTYSGKLAYCTPEMDCTDGDMITNVNFAGINKTTTCSTNGYGDYTSARANAQAGNTVPISVTVGDAYYYESVAVWIDYNNDGNFSEDEYTFIGTAEYTDIDTGNSKTLTGNITIPSDIANGEYRMRVRLAADDENGVLPDMACDDSEIFGETEDYTILVGPFMGTTNAALSSVSFYPNPVKDELNIVSKEKITSVSVYNVAGQKVLNNIHLKDGKVNMSRYAAGTYIVTAILESGKTEIFKIIKK